MLCDHCRREPAIAVLSTWAGEEHVCAGCYDKAVEHEQRRYKWVPGSIAIPKGLLSYVTQTEADAD